MIPVNIGSAELHHLSQNLRTLDVFTSLTMTELDQLLRSIRLYLVPAKSYVFRKGDPGDALFIVYEGTLTVRKNRFFCWPWKIVGHLKTGDYFGEMALLAGGVRTASIRAETDSKLFALLRIDFNDFLERNPAFAKDIRRIADLRKFENMWNRV